MKNPMRRLGERLRALADEAWDRGNRELASELHDKAREAEKLRRNHDFSSTK